MIEFSKISVSFSLGIVKLSFRDVIPAIRRGTLIEQRFLRIGYIVTIAGCGALPRTARAEKRVSARALLSHRNRSRIKSQTTE